jgi:hypothetical protein
VQLLMEKHRPSHEAQAPHGTVLLLLLLLPLLLPPGD